MSVLSVNIDAWEKIWHLCIRSSSVNIAYRHAAVYYVHNRMIIKQQYFQEKENLLFLQPLWLSDSVGHWIESVICLVYLHMQNVDDQSIGHRTMIIRGIRSIRSDLKPHLEIWLCWKYWFLDFIQFSNEPTLNLKFQESICCFMTCGPIGF